jgi:integrase
LIEDVDLDRGWLKVSNKPELGWSVKMRRERRVPLIDEAAGLLRHLISSRVAGPVLLRPRATDSLALFGADRRAMAAACEERVARREAHGASLARAEVARIQRSVWRDAGAVTAARIRVSFMQTALRCGLPDASCPKSWRHTFATLLQDANVDPLIRQHTLGHSPTFGPESALGMTSHYTHTRPETLRREIERAMRLWPESLELPRARSLFQPGGSPISTAESQAK